jgi:DNA-binding NarL/FixJ family response regulator
MESMSGTTVMIVDQQPILSQGLAMALAEVEGLQVLGSVANAQDALELSLELLPDVIVLDPEIATRELIEGLRSRPRPASIILLFPNSDPASIERSRWIRATTLLMRDTSLQDLVEAIRAASERGDRGPVDASSPPAREHLSALESLSPRETEILELLTMGLSQRVIANRLNLAVNTVRTHTRNIQLKLRVHSNLEAVSLWLSHRSHAV